jgi:hypothetical protein
VLPPPSSTGTKRQRMNSFSTSTMGKAAEEGDLARVQEAVEAGEDVNQADPANVSAVLLVCRHLVVTHEAARPCMRSRLGGRPGLLVWSCLLSHTAVKLIYVFLMCVCVSRSYAYTCHPNSAGCSLALLDCLYIC